MIKYIEFDNFKCLSGKAFNLNKINLFTGYNGRGKSSVIQAILLLFQSVRNGETESFRNLHLNGDLVQLGDFDELLTDTERLDFTIKLIVSNSTDHNVVLGYKMSDDFKVGKLCHCIIDHEDFFESPGSFSASEKIIDNASSSSEKDLKQLPPFLFEQFSAQKSHFVAADRQGPVKFVEKQEIPKYFKVGPNGSMTINTLATYNEFIPHSMNLSNDDDRDYDLNSLVSMWVDFIMNGGSISINGKDSLQGNKTIRPKSSILELDFGFDDRLFRSYNVGFGYSYILPIVVTSLIAKTNDLVIIENPEAHLHPEAQTRLTFMLAKLATRGVQVFIETHSEHVINGIRLAALKKEYELSNEDVRIFFFDNDFQKIDLKIESNGRINNWPDRFFDQYQKELAEILKLSAGIKT